LTSVLTNNRYIVVIISNQGAIPLKPNPKALTVHRTRLEGWKRKVTDILRDLDLPTTIYAATAFDKYRKPRTGMWDEILEDYDLTPQTVDLEGSFFVGDAAGRTAVPGVEKDFSDSDRHVAPFLAYAEAFYIRTY
jgi:bifunctional polynucleotide phosphatase/kinase